MRSLSEIIGGLLHPHEAGPPLQFFNTQTTLPQSASEAPDPKQPTTSVPQTDTVTTETIPQTPEQRAA